MWKTFCAYGNYENRGKARSRFIVEALGGAENYVKAFDIVVTQQNRPDLVGKLNKMLSINTKHIQRRYERASTSVKQ